MNIKKTIKDEHDFVNVITPCVELLEKPSYSFVRKVKYNKVRVGYT